MEKLRNPLFLLRFRLIDFTLNTPATAAGLSLVRPWWHLCAIEAGLVTPAQQSELQLNYGYSEVLSGSELMIYSWWCLGDYMRCQRLNLDQPHAKQELLP